MSEERLVPESVRLAFHPDDADADFQAVWQDSIARLVWIAWKWKHIVNQHFNDECLEAAELIRQGKRLHDGSWRLEGNFRCTSASEFWRQFQAVLDGGGIRVSYPGRFGWMITETLTPGDTSPHERDAQKSRASQHIERHPQQESEPQGRRHPSHRSEPSS